MEDDIGDTLAIKAADHSSAYPILKQTVQPVHSPLLRKCLARIRDPSAAASSAVVGATAYFRVPVRCIGF